MARAYPGQGNPFGPLYMLAGLLTLGCSVAILVIVNVYLWYTTYYYGSGFIVWSNVCYMQTPTSQDSDINICYYSWAAAGVGIFLSLWLFFMQMCSGRSRHIPVCEVMVCLVAVLWWIGCAVTGTIYGQNADDFAANPPSGASNEEYAAVLADKQGWRTAVWALAWAEMGIWVICLLATLKDCASQRGKPPPEPNMAGGGYPAGAYAQPYTQPPPQYGYGAPPPPQYAGYPPAGSTYPPPGQSPFQSSGAPAGYPPA